MLWSYNKKNQKNKVRVQKVQRKVMCICLVRVNMSASTACSYFTFYRVKNRTLPLSRKLESSLAGAFALQSLVITASQP